MKALIQAGGAGTRLKSITGDLPKPMVKINGKPILEWQLLSLALSGVKEAVIVIGKNGDSIPSYFGNGERFGLSIRYIKEEQPLGTAGALAYIKEDFNEDFFVVFGDLMLDVDWGRFLSFHKEKKSALTSFAHPNSHPFDSDLLVVDEESKILSIDSKNNVRDYYYENLTNAGLYVASPEVFSFVDEPRKIDFEKDLLSAFIKEGKAYAYRSSEYVKDCGTPERFSAVNQDSLNGIISAKSLRNKQKALFLDRDGVINKFGDFVVNEDMLSLCQNASKAIKLINDSSYLAICITNQPVIARGEVTFEGLRKIHNKMETLLGKDGAYLNDLFFCPHHPDKGYEGEVKELKFDCSCRKPKIGLLLKAQEKYNIDFSQSYFIGDTCRDVQTGINAGCKTILVTSGDPIPARAYGDAKADYVKKDLYEAVNFILGKGGN